MASYNKFHQHVENLAHGVHNLSTGQMKVALTAAANAPVASNTVLANLTEIGNYANLSGGTPLNIATSSSGQTTGTYKLILTDLTLTATGTVGPFRYVVIYNDTPTSPADPLIGWYDYGSEVTMNSGETFLIDFDGTDGLFTLV